MRTKHIAFIILLSAFIEVLMAPVRTWINFQTSTLLGFILYLLLTVFCLHKFQSKTASHWILIYILIGILLIQIPTRFPKFDSTIISLPDFIIHLLGIIIGFLYFKVNRSIGIIIVCLGLLISLFMFVSGYEKYIHKLNYGSYSGIVLRAVPEFSILKENGEEFTNENLKGKIVVLDFWNTGCGVCFKRFPVLEEKYITYKDHPDIEFYAVNIPLKRDSIGQAVTSIRERKYSFPVLLAKNDSIAKAFSINGYPSVFVIKNGEQIVYYGEIENVDDVINEIKNDH